MTKHAGDVAAKAAEAMRARCEALMRHLADHAETHQIRGVSPYHGRSNQFAMAYEDARAAIAALSGETAETKK